jgi:uncharacterized protein
MSFERIVLDSNVLISAAITPHGKPYACLSWVLDHATLILAREVVEEVETRLARPKFHKYVDEGRRKAFASDLRESAVLVALTGTLRACRDPDDDKLLEAAVLGNAGYLVTGDKDLLVMSPFQNIQIVSPAAFLMLIP